MSVYYSIIFVLNSSFACFLASTTASAGTANGTPTETELPTPTSSAPETGGNPASLALRNALRSVFRTESDSTQRNENTAQRSEDLPVFDTP